MNNQTNPDAITTVIKGVSLVNPAAGYFLEIAWNSALENRASKLGEKLKEFSEKSEDKGWDAKAAGAFAKIFPKPPKDQEDAEKLLKNLSNDNYKNIEEKFSNFLIDGDDKEFLDNIKEIFDTDNSIEALKLFFKMNELIVSQKIFQEFVSLHNLNEENREKLEKQLEYIDKKFESNILQLERNRLTLDEGFYIISPVYFESHKSRGINNWIEGWKFNLFDVYIDCDYKRKIVNEIEKNGNFLISGKSGYSKSTTLYRIICDYYSKGYNIVASLDEFGGGAIEHPQKIVEVIKELMVGGNVLVAIDDVQNKPQAFEIIKRLEDNLDNIKFVFTARLPEFDDLHHEGQKKYLYNWEDIDYSLEKLMTEKKIEDFDPEEAESFISKYYPLIHHKKIPETELRPYSQKLYRNSKNGNPIMFKFLLTGKGLMKDIERKYSDYIFDKQSANVNPLSLKCTIFSCILDCCGIQITNELANKCKFDLGILKNSILKYNQLKGTWETMHPIWAANFLIFWYTKSKKEGNPREVIKKIIQIIIDIKDNEITYNLIGSLSTLISNNKDLFDLFENSLNIPKYLNDLYKAELYAFSLSNIYIEKNAGKALILIDKGLNIYKKLIKDNENLNKEFAAAFYNEGRAHFNSEDPQKALESYDKALLITPEFDYPWIGKGAALTKLGKNKEALYAYDKAIEINPDSVYAWRNKSDLLANLNKDLDALKAYNKLLKLNPKESSSWYNKGTALGHLGKNWEALTAFDKSLELDPEFADAWKNKGTALVKLGKHSQALEAYNKALEFDPEDPSTWYNKGKVLIVLERHQDALKAFNKASELDPEDPASWHDKGTVLIDLERYHEALTAFNKALKFEPEDPSTWYNKGNVLDDLELHRDALNAYNKAIELDPKFADAWNNKGYVLLELREYQEALVALDKAQELDPESSSMLYNKGKVLVKLLRNPEALKYLDKFLEIKPRYAEAWYNKGIALKNIHKYPEAMEAFSKALEIDPEFEDALRYKTIVKNLNLL